MCIRDSAGGGQRLVAHGHRGQAPLRRARVGQADLPVAGRRAAVQPAYLAHVDQRAFQSALPEQTRDAIGDVALGLSLIHI